MTDQRTTTQRVSAGNTQKERDALLRVTSTAHPAGGAGYPCTATAPTNWDHNPASNDRAFRITRSRPLTRANARRHQSDRLLHGVCKQAAPGRQPRLLGPAVTGQHPSEPILRTNSASASSPGPDEGTAMKPTIGRIVHFHHTDGRVLAAIVTAVYSDTMSP